MKFGDVLNRVSELIENEEIFQDIRPAFIDEDDTIILFLLGRFVYANSGDDINMVGLDFISDIYTEVLFDIKRRCLID